MKPLCSITGCDKPQVARGWCGTHHKRWSMHGDANYSFHSPESQRQRFWEKIATKGRDECWIWQWKLTKEGYGRSSVRINGRSWRIASRVAYYFHFGIDPGPLEVCHRCDKPPCCNPHHLFLGTRQQNAGDMAGKGRSLIGERNPQAKITEVEAITIKRRVLAGEAVSAVARDFGLTHMAVKFIKMGKNWSHVQI